MNRDSFEYSAPETSTSLLPIVPAARNESLFTRPQTEGIVESFTMVLPRAKRGPLPASAFLEPLYDEDDSKLYMPTQRGMHHLRQTILEDGVKRVSDGIGDDFKLWTPDTPIFIDAQTGSGKNYFIENRLVPYVDEQNYFYNVNDQILILVNRIALSKQERKRIEDSGIVKIVSYQGLHKFLEFRSNLKKFKYVVCDEAHFFTSDAMFNPNTYEILKEIVSNFREHAVRIYMSSTMDDCVEYILDCENLQRDQAVYPPHRKYKKKEVLLSNGLDPICYKFERNYDYLDIKYYTEFSELPDIIIPSISSGEKWLIFIDSRSMCSKLKQSLIECSKDLLSDEDIMVISADSKGEVNYEEAIINEKFKCKILISTSVIDNGVNIKDSKLRNIVICSVDKDKCLQMLGRKRIEDGDRINLYLKKFDVDYIKELIDGLEHQHKAYHLYNLAYRNNYDTMNSAYDIKKKQEEFIEKFYNGEVDDFKDAKHWFLWNMKGLERYSSDPPALPNEIAVSMVDDVLLPRYKRILEKVMMTGDGLEFLEEQLGWFGKTYDERCDITVCGVKAAKEEFGLYLEDLPGRFIPKEEQDLFKKEFFEIYNAAHGFRANDNKSRAQQEGYGKNVINGILAEMDSGLQIQSSRDGWEIIFI